MEGIGENPQQAATAVYVAVQAIDWLKLLWAPILPHSSERLHSMLGYGAPLFGRQYTEIVEGAQAAPGAALRPHATSGRWKPPRCRPTGRCTEPAPLFVKLDDAHGPKSWSRRNGCGMAHLTSPPCTAHRRNRAIYRPISAPTWILTTSGGRAVILCLIVLGYLVAATLFAVTTPAWQNPDEPPTSQQHRLHCGGVMACRPASRRGMTRRTSAGCSPRLSGLPSTTLRYDLTRPPLYYVTAAAICWATAVFAHTQYLQRDAGRLRLRGRRHGDGLPRKPLLTPGRHGLCRVSAHARRRRTPR